MSVESSWDLRSKSSPRSLCVYSPTWVDQDVVSNSGSTNPFEVSISTASSSNENVPSPQAIVFGTERGSLHYRTYAPPSPHSRGGLGRGSSVGVGSSGGRSGSGGSSSSSLQSPLGMTSTPTSSGRNAAASSSTTPKSLFPVDLPTASLPGIVTAVIRACPYSSGNGSTTVTSQQQKNPVFLLLIDDNRGTSAANPGAYAARLVCLQHASTGGIGTFKFLSTQLPRMSCAAYHPRCGFVYAKGSTIATITPDIWEKEVFSNVSTSNPSNMKRSASLVSQSQRFTVFCKQPVLPHAGARSGQDALTVTGNGRVAVVAVANSFYAVPGIESSTDEASASVTSGTSTSVTGSSHPPPNAPKECIHILSFTQSSQVHPVIVLDVNDLSVSPDWSVLFLASGRDCAVVDLHHGPPAAPTISVSKPRHGNVNVASPILAASSSWPWLALLTSDGLISIRSPACMGIPLRTVEVGTRPNDYFVLRSLPPQPHNQDSGTSPLLNSINVSTHLMSISYSGEGKVLTCLPDTAQELADRLMRLSIDAFGSNGFPRAELAEAVNASFTSTSYVGPEPTILSRSLLRQYLEAVLGLSDFDSNGISGWPTELQHRHNALHNTDRRSPTGDPHHVGAFWGFGSDAHHNRNEKRLSKRKVASPLPTVVTASSPAGLLTGTALLCLVCSQLSPAQAQLACRAAKSCMQNMGVVVESSPDVSDASKRVCELVAQKLLSLVSNNFTLTQPSVSVSITPTSSARNIPHPMEFVEAAVWLLRSCGKHEEAIEVLHDRLQQHQQQGGAGVSSIEKNHSNTDSSTFFGVGLEVGHSNSSGSAAGAGIEVKKHDAHETEFLSNAPRHGLWSKIKYESYTATHLSELWGSGKDEACKLVLRSSATRRLLENNPRLGLSAFTALHPQNTTQWKNLLARDDPLSHKTYPLQVVKLLKSIHPALPYFHSQNNDSNRKYENRKFNNDAAHPNDSIGAAGAAVSVISTIKMMKMDDAMLYDLPLESGRALAISFLESAMGIYTGRPTEGDEFDNLAADENLEERIANFHDELSYLLLEGIISERGDESHNNDKASGNIIENKNEEDTDVGQLYRNKLRRFLQWPLCKIRSEQFLSSLPNSFLFEKALVYGRLGKHEDALRILYKDLFSMDLALQYCDIRYERQKLVKDRKRIMVKNYTQGTIFEDFAKQDEGEGLHNYSNRFHNNMEDSTCAYLPLVRVALEESGPSSHVNNDSDYVSSGTTAAIQVLALRRSQIDRAAALRLLPQNIPVDAVARPFLIPTLVDSESQVRRLKVVSSLLRARYVNLKQTLTSAQLKAQSHISVVPQFKSLRLGDILHSTKPNRARPSSTASPTFPDVVIIKFFFARHLIIQAKITHNLEGRVLGDVNFVVAESSEEAIQPLMQVPLKLLPNKIQGSSWCVLSAAPQRMDPLAILTCELRYSILEATPAETLISTGLGRNDNEGNNPFGSYSTPGLGTVRTYVEELQDLEVHASLFS